MRRIIVLVLSMILASSPLYADTVFSDPDKFKEFNPDGQKFQFVRDYISSLGYLYANYQRDEKIKSSSLEVLDQDKRHQMLVDNLSTQNVNVRVARNLLKRYKASDNGLVLKAVDLFTEVCDGFIKVNDKEKGLLEEINAQKKEAVPSDAVAGRFKRLQKNLAHERKEVSKLLLQSSVVVGKLLVSNQEDKFGELVNLGVTQEERKKLLEQLNAFSGDKFKGKIRPGQSFLEGSVASIRQVLEDPSWGTVQGGKK